MLCLNKANAELRKRMTSSEDFGVLREYSEMIVSFFKNPSTPRIKISLLYFRKSWQV